MINDLQIENEVHKPVLLKEVVQAFGLFAPLKNQSELKKPIAIDATLGAGGHTKSLIDLGYFVLGIDADRDMIEIAGDNLRSFIDQKFAHRAGELSESEGPPGRRPLRSEGPPGRRPSGSETCPTGNYDTYFKIVKGNFIDIDSIASENGLKKVNAVLMDLGISSYHYQFLGRGFSFQDPTQQLDMRLNDDQGVMASDLLNMLPKNSLMSLFLECMTYQKAQFLTNGVIERRKIHKFETVGDFLEITNRLLRFSTQKRRTDISTLPFMALRIAVNSELDNLKIGLVKSLDLLEAGGKLAVISFHSGEDRIVKNFFQEAEKRGVAEVEKVVMPSENEIALNLRSRSAKLRILQKI